MLNNSFRQDKNDIFCQFNGFIWQVDGGNYGGLSDLRSVVMIDELVATGQKSGYTFVVTPENGGSPKTFVIDAVPTNPTAGITQTGTRRFCINTQGIIRADADETNLGTQITSSTDCNYGTIVQ